MHSNMILLQQMLVLFFIMMIGFICRKKGMLDDNANRKISGIVVNVANPALILSACMNNGNAIEGREFLVTFFLAICLYAAFILAAIPVTKLLRVKREDEGVYKAMLVFSNMGFMGFPVISAVYGKEALLYASLFLIPFNILIYTYGIHVLSGSAVQNEGSKKSIEWKKILNVGVIAGIFSILIYTMKLPVPIVIQNTVDSLSALTAPLSMLVIGDAMAQIKLKELFADKHLLAFSVIKLVVLPVVGTRLLRLCGLNEMLLGVCMIILATPVGSMTAMLAKQYDGNYGLASKGVTLTTLLSVITMPLISMIA